MPWARKQRVRIKRHNDIPAFLQKAGAAIKEWALLQKSAAVIGRTSDLLARAAFTKNAIALKTCIQKLRIELKNVEAVANKAMKG